MKMIFSILLAVAGLLSLAACDRGGAAAPVDTTPDTTPLVNFKADDASYPTINQKLTWDAINAIPIKNEDMTVEEMRQLCVDFMNFSKTAMYIPNDYLGFEKNNKGTADEMVRGQIYAGLPYIGGGGCGNVYRLMD